MPRAKLPKPGGYPILSLPTALLLLGLQVSCTLHTRKTGLVQVDDRRVLLVEGEGRTWRVLIGEDSEPLRYLEGARVVVEGRRFGRKLVPEDWKVIDAGDGSAPYIGVLQRHGSNWIMQDRNSGALIQLEEQSLGGLSAHAGDVVMVIGYVVGAHRVNVVMWKVLEPE